MFFQDLWVKMDKKASSNLTGGMVLAIFLGIVLVFFLFGGGASTILGITKFMKQVPVWAWVIVIILFVFRRWGK